MKSGDKICYTEIMYRLYGKTIETREYEIVYIKQLKDSELLVVDTGCELKIITTKKSLFYPETLNKVSSTSSLYSEYVYVWSYHTKETDINEALEKEALRKMSTECLDNLRKRHFY